MTAIFDTNGNNDINSYSKFGSLSEKLPATNVMWSSMFILLI